jgi:hypothetical protein
MKIRWFLGGLCAAVGALLLASPAGAAPTDSNAGSIKVKTHGDSVFPPENDPQISGCPAAFDIYAYNFAHAQVSWNISQQPPTGTQMVASGTTTLTADSPQPAEGPRFHGYLVFGNVSLPDGHYEVDAHEVGANGTGKQKVFWIKSTCSSTGGGNGGGSGGGGNGGGNGGGGNGGGGNGGNGGNGGSGGGTGGTGGGGTGATGAGASGGGGQAAAAQGGVLAATATATAAGGQGIVLAQTGLPVGGGLFGLLLTGLGLVLRRRR